MVEVPPLRSYSSRGGSTGRMRVASWRTLPAITRYMDFHADCQLILPTDKRNPSLSLCLTKDGQSFQVFYGFECLEVVPNDPEHMAFRMMVGRLYNADIRTATLEEVFNLDRKTIRSWGLAILSRNPNLLARVMLGRAAKQKRTPAIDRFVVRRRQELLHEGCLNYGNTCTRTRLISPSNSRHLCGALHACPMAEWTASMKRISNPSWHSA